MPGVTIRLTPTQHDQLRRWAFENKRSLQAEVVHRIFFAGKQNKVVVKPQQPVVADAQPRDLPSRKITPDFT